MKCDFFQWRSLRQIEKNKGSKEGVKEMYGRLAAWFHKRGDNASVTTCHAELEWFQHGNPYYKIYPAMAQALSHCKVDIDCRYLNLPFPTFEIRLPKSPLFREAPGTPAVRNILVHKIQTPFDAAGWKDGRDWTFVAQYQLDCDIDADWMGWYYAFGAKDGEIIADRLESTWKRTDYSAMEGYKPSKEFSFQIVRLAIATCFFGCHQHELIMPDIPNKLIERYRKAKETGDEADEQRVLEKSRNAGHNGFKIGSEIDLPRPRIKYLGEAPEPTGQGHQLEYGHLRNGHMRLQPYGSRPGSGDPPTHYELIFIAPTVVRPDLPLRETRGFRIKDTLLENPCTPST